ncbi:hypothetical protein TNCV_1796621 [Trichonephila clavipes]|nr:hypothetical protein TNCV_1796621 [Trichonephila clavipes]
MDSWLACHEFESSTTEDSLCRGAMFVKSVESSNVHPLVWCGRLGVGVLAQVSSSSLAHGSKMTRSVAKSPRVAENVILIFSHSRTTIGFMCIGLSIRKREPDTLL